MKKNQKRPAVRQVRYAVIVTWQPSRVACRFGFIQAFLTPHEMDRVGADVTDLDHIGGRIMVVAADARIGQRVPLSPEDKAAA
jgi:hypothetical protein